jgi:endo-1,4-beta-mannosidase
VGAKTNAFCLNLEKYSTDSETLAKEVIAVCQEWANHFSDYQNLETAYNVRVSEINREVGRGGNIQPRIDNDNELRKINDQLELVVPNLNTSRTERKLVLAKLQAMIRSLKTETANFSAYISKKEKSKNIFRGKKSLSTAKTAITGANDLIVKLENLNIG